MHLSALLNDNDVVVYQTGYWYVDGVLVGDDNGDACFEYCQVENIQIVWTHNCEHGVIRGWKLLVQHPAGGEATTTAVVLQRMDEFVEFGPEQLLAKIPVEWDRDDESQCRPLVSIGDVLWKEHMITG